MAMGNARVQDTLHRHRSMQKRPCDSRRRHRQAFSRHSCGRHHCRAQASCHLHLSCARPLPNRVGAKLVPNYLENITSPDQYQLLEMVKISGFVDRQKGLGRPTKKDGREIQKFTQEAFYGFNDFMDDDDDDDDDELGFDYYDNNNR